MPHVPGQGPSFGFPLPWQVALQAMPGFMPPEAYGQIGRGFLDFVPGVGTALNWNQMGPIGRGVSVGLDVVDLATAGGGKPLTAGLRLGGKGFLKFLRRKDAPAVFIRSGSPPSEGVPYQELTPEYLPDPDIAAQYAAGRGQNIPVGPSLNWAYTPPRPEAGISVFQAMKYPPSARFPNYGEVGWYGPISGKPQYVLRPAQETVFMPPQYPGGPRLQNAPRAMQNELLKDVKEGTAPPFYEYSGVEILPTRGSDLESLIDPAAGIKRITQIDPAETIWTLDQLNELEKTSVLGDFMKYDYRGRRFPTAFETWADYARFPPALPFSTPARGLGLPYYIHNPNAPVSPLPVRAAGEGHILPVGAL